MLLCFVWRCESCLWPTDSGKVNIKENLVTESIHLKHEEHGRNNKQSRKSPFLLLKYVPTKQLVNGIKMLEERIDIYIRAKRRYISKVSSYKLEIFIRTEFVHTFLMADWTCEKPVKKQYIYSNMTVFDTWGTHSCGVKADITGVFSPAATTIVSSLRHRNIWRIFMNKSISAAANKNIYYYASNRL